MARTRDFASSVSPSQRTGRSHGFCASKGSLMPQWRKLHSRIRQSLDVNDMPDDFHRLLWSWLPLGLDREGRILDNVALVKARTMPLREDVALQQMQQALDWYVAHGMLVRYSVNGRSYLYAPTFRGYQGRRGREAVSIYPAPLGQDQVNDEVPDPVTDQVAPRIEQNQKRREVESEQNRSRSKDGSVPSIRGFKRPADLISSQALSDSDLKPKRGPPATDAARIEHAIQIRERAEHGKLPTKEEATMRRWATKYGAARLYEATQRTAFKKPKNFGAYLRKTLENPP